MRTAAILITLAAAMASSDASAAQRLTRLPVVGPFVADTVSGAYVSTRAVSVPGAPFAAFAIHSRDDRGAGDLSQLGFSSLPFQIAFDPLAVARRRLAYSQCLPPAATTVATCAIGSYELFTGNRVVVSDPGAGVRDRLPAVYGSAIAFARTHPGEPTVQLRYTPAPGQASVRLRGGPAGVAQATALGVALKATTVAYVWQWRVTPSRQRTALMFEAVGHKRHTVLALDSTRGRILGVAWQGRRLLFAIRRATTSRLYEYDPTSDAFRSAAGPRNLGAFAIAGPALYWQTASDHALTTGVCAPPGCQLLRGQARSGRRRLLDRRPACGSAASSATTRVQADYRTQAITVGAMARADEAPRIPHAVLDRFRPA